MTPLTVGSTFTGVGGADLGFEQAGFQISWQCELDAWKRSVLAAHWPDVQIFDDITTMLNPPPVDILIGGFPCQDLSVAGQRKGFTGERSVLAFEFLRLAESIRPRWLVLENVPGLLSSSQGADFARLIDEVVACGYGVAWRILDARFFGVPQRRRRVFIVARRTDALIDSPEASRLALRALRESGSGDIASGWQAWQETAGSAGEGAEGSSSVGTHGPVAETQTGTLTRMYAEQSGQDFGGGGWGRDNIYNATAAFGAWTEDTKAGVLSKRDYKSTNHLLVTDGGGLAFRKSRRAQTMNDDETWVEGDHANTLNSFDAGDVRTTHAIIAHGVSASDDKVAGTLCTNSQGGQRTTDIAGAYVTETFPIDDGRDLEKHQNGTGIGAAGDPAYTIDRQQLPAVAQTFSVYPEAGNGADIAAAKVDRSPALTKVKSERGIHVTDQMSVRRLSPVECERLMGWPDQHTAPEGVKAPDSKRYAACGDGIVAPVAFWIADRISMIEGEA